MALRMHLSLLLAVATLATTYADNNESYRAAVVNYEYQRLENGTDARQNLMTNVRNYETFLKQAQEQQVDIIVFPEEGLLGSNDSISFVIPDPALKLVPNASYDESLQILSGYAKTYNMYLAVNVRENITDPSTKKTYKYNTNIVFDKSGALIARYRKYNLYGEPGIDHPETPDYSTFTAFNVTFGQFICFDILFKEPALTLISKYNVTNFIYPSKWYSELPFLTSSQTQWSWAVGNNVNLLSAGSRNLTMGNTGSGIFRGKNAQNNLFSFDDNQGSTMLVGDVPKNRNGSTSGSGKDVMIPTSNSTQRLPLMQQPNMNQFAHETIDLPTNSTSTHFKKEVCHNKLCCNFDLSVQYSLPTQRYKAVVFDGTRTFGATGKDEFGLQVCGVVMCYNSSISSCDSPTFDGVAPSTNTGGQIIKFTDIRIDGNFIQENANPLPNILLWPAPSGSNVPTSFLIAPSDVTFNSNQTVSSLFVAKQNQYITVAIHSRVFSRDPRTQGNGAGMANVSMMTVILSIVPILMRYT